MLKAAARLSTPFGYSAKTLPAGISWDTVNFNFIPSIFDPGGYKNPAVGRILAADGTPYTPETFFATKSTALTAPAATYYVAVTGNDANSGLSVGQAVKSIWKAMDLLRIANVVGLIIVAGGIYDRVNGLNNGGGADSPVMLKDFAIWYQGPVETGVFGSLTFAPDGTFPRVYTTTRANVNQVLDLRNKDQFGNWLAYTYVPTLAECAETPNSWTDNGLNVSLWINRADGLAVDSTDLTRAYGTGTVNTRVLLQGNTLKLVYSGAFPNIYMGLNNTSQAFYNIYGGNTGFSLIYNGTSANAISNGKKLCVLGPGKFVSVGGKTSGNGRLLEMESYYGLTAFFNVTASGGTSDGFNFHNAVGWNAGVPTYTTYHLTVNCRADNNGVVFGQVPAGTSNNGWTAHENCVAIDIASYFSYNRGGSVRSANSAKHYLLGTTVKDDLGDITNGGTLYPVAFSCDADTTFYLEQVKVDMPAGSLGIVGVSTVPTYGRNIWPTPAIINNVTAF